MLGDHGLERSAVLRGLELGDQSGVVGGEARGRESRTVPDALLAQPARGDPERVLEHVDRAGVALGPRGEGGATRRDGTLRVLDLRRGRARKLRACERLLERQLRDLRGVIRREARALVHAGRATVRPRELVLGVSGRRGLTPGIASDHGELGIAGELDIVACVEQRWVTRTPGRQRPELDRRGAGRVLLHARAVVRIMVLPIARGLARRRDHDVRIGRPLASATLRALRSAGRRRRT